MVNPVVNPASPTVRRAQQASLAALLALIALGLAWELWLAPTGRGTLALKVLPLALCLRGVWLHRMRVYRWLSLLVWLYFIEGAVRVFGDAGRTGGMSRALAALEIALCIALFATVSFYIRWRLGHASADAPDHQGQS